jgi:hypothetical protein
MGGKGRSIREGVVLEIWRKPMMVVFHIDVSQTSPYMLLPPEEIPPDGQAGRVRVWQGMEQTVSLVKERLKSTLYRSDKPALAFDVP